MAEFLKFSNGNQNDDEKHSAQNGPGPQAGEGRRGAVAFNGCRVKD
jgi:hypothetical protein